MKRISPGTVTVGVLAIVCGLVAAFVIKQMNEKPVVKVQKPVGPVIVVAKANISKHARIRIGDLETISLPAGQKVPEGIITKSAIAAGRIIKAPLRAGQAIHEKMLFGIGESTPGLVERIPAGFRALTIAVEKSTLSTAVLEDDAKVDIAMTVEGTHPDLGELATRTLLRSVPVLDYSRNNRSGPLNLTIAVTPKDANKLINAQKSSTLNVTLCSNTDGESPVREDDSITRRELLGLSEIPAPPKPVTIEKWEGSQLRQLQFNQQPTNATPVLSAPQSPIKTTSYRGPSVQIAPKVSGPQ